jgi:hypothetical protein
MWSFHTKRNTLRETLLSSAPEVNPHEFVRRLLVGKAHSSAKFFKAAANSEVPTHPETVRSTMELS